MTGLHPQLARDCLVLGRFELCSVLLMRDANYPWFILVPERGNVTEIFQLPEADRQQLIQESSLFGQVLYREFAADKLNIAALGNVVPQLHIHHVVRYQTDPAWPDPIWGRIPVADYSDNALSEIVTKTCDALATVPELGFKKIVKTL
jgi:diadenosine tetraphosphate (Ap4A) HIT family hydrolase